MATHAWPGTAPMSFLTFDGAHATAEECGATYGHRLRWMTWGNPPRAGHGLCERCSRDLRIERVRGGAFRLHGSALQPCAPPSLVLGYTPDTARPAPMRPVSGAAAWARDGPRAHAE